jgi:hypothetical protein
LVSSTLEQAMNQKLWKLYSKASHLFAYISGKVLLSMP